MGNMGKGSLVADDWYGYPWDMPSAVLGKGGELGLLMMGDVFFFVSRRRLRIGHGGRP